jgi:hypothetical protein
MKIIINNEEEYSKALGMLDQVFTPNSPAQQELMLALVDAIGEYEEEHHPIEEPTDEEQKGKDELKLAPFTIFGKTKMLPIVVWENGGKINTDTWDTELWVERSEDWYALSSPQLKNKKVRIVTREDWLSA